MSENTPSTEKLEKQIRMLKKKLERSEWHRVDLENQHDRDQHLYRRLQDDLEAAKREAQIEAALERIRAQSLRMAHSSELVATSAVFHEQLLALGVDTEFSYVWLPDEAAGKHQFWATWTEEADGEPAHRSHAVTYDLDKEEPYTAACFAAWESDESLFIDLVPPADVQGFFSAWPEVFERAVHMRPEHFPDGLYYAEAYVQYGCFGLDIRREPTDEERDIIRRVAVEFERAYTRYLDLQKAEAQTREARIEAAMERVRSRAMAMHSSDELGDVVARLFDELTGLDLDLTRCALWVFDPDTRGARFWIANQEHPDAPESYAIPYHDHPAYLAFLEAWDRRETAWVYDLHGDLKTTWDDVLFNETELARLPADVKAGMRAPDRVLLTASFTDFGAFHAAGLEPLSDESTAILRRFAKVFDQTYTRYLDLEQAEARAREAEIEAALERVRSRTMAMQSSNELAETSALLFAQIKGLGIETWTSGFNILEDDGRACVGYNATPAGGLGRPMRLPLTEDSFFQTIHEARARGDEFLVFESEGESLAQTYRYMLTLPVVRDVMQGIVDEGYSLPTYQVTHCGFFSHGHLMFITLEPSPEAWNVFKRFTGVFEQTYTRFLDLEQAEARAREAQIEAALERVRSRTLAMTTSEELLDIIHKIHHEYAGLGLPCEVFWQTRYTPESYLKAVTSVGGERVSAIMELPRDFSRVPELAAWEQGDEKVGVFQFDAESAAAYVHHMNTKGHFHRVDPDGITPEVARALGGLTFVQARTSHGEIGYALWGQAEPTEEALDVLARFTTVFDLAYRRFEDLRKAEADHKALLEEKALTERALVELRATQAQLIQQEKLASLGALTAGIAHEIKNPLNFVTNFADVSQELVEEIREAAERGDELAPLLAELAQTTQVIGQHGRRADAIVKAMMQHAQASSGERETVEFNPLVAEHVALAHHGRRAQTPGFDVTLVEEYDDSVGPVTVQPQELGRVVVNLVTNAFDAVAEHALSHPGSGDGEAYVPRVVVSTFRDGDEVLIRVADNGPGMSAAVKAKAFEPFFTTKPTGSGTGLGLSLSYDIVTQGHGGTLTVEEAPEGGAAFVVCLPAPMAS